MNVHGSNDFCQQGRAHHFGLMSGLLFDGLDSAYFQFLFNVDFKLMSRYFNLNDFTMKISATNQGGLPKEVDMLKLDPPDYES